MTPRDPRIRPLPPLPAFAAGPPPRPPDLDISERPGSDREEVDTYLGRTVWGAPDDDDDVDEDDQP